MVLQKRAVREASRQAAWHCPLASFLKARLTKTSAWSWHAVLEGRHPVKAGCSQARPGRRAGGPAIWTRPPPSYRRGTAGSPAPAKGIAFKHDFVNLSPVTLRSAISGSRPGRPPKRSLGVAIQENARLLPHGVPGLLSPGLISPTAVMSLEIPTSSSRSRCPSAKAAGRLRATAGRSSSSSHVVAGSLKTNHCNCGLTAAAMAEAMKLQKMKLMAMNSLHGSGSQNGTESENEELNSNAVRVDFSHIDRSSGTSRTQSHEEVQIAIPIMKPTLDKVQLAGQALPPGFPAPFLFADGLSSVETLLTNIQGLLKVAVDNARVQEKQIQQEKKELKMELCRERELRESLERQLTAELQSRATIQKRLKKEKKAKRKLQEALEFESKRREQVEQALKQATSDAGIPDMEIEHNGTQHDSAAMQEEELKHKR
ncbi:Dachshund-like protein 2 isoform X3 [Aix galericulata]|nr:Dachshund-like protein 2 isoform X3 [Aix galericulata]